MFIIAGIGVVVVVAGALGLGSLFRAYPAEIIFSAVAITATATAAVIARARSSARNRVPLAIGPPKAPRIVRSRVIPPAVARVTPAGRDLCEAPGCGRHLDADPWKAEVDSGPHKGEHRFCSGNCTAAWQELVLAPSSR